jgi:hypothetical protein
MEPPEARMSMVNVEAVSRTMQAVLAREGRAVIYLDRATGADFPITPGTAASPTGLLPALAVAGETVWREATGKGFALDIVRDPDAMLGYRLRAIGAGSLTTVILSMMEATAQVARPGAIMVHDLHALWSAATDRIESTVRLAPRRAAGAAP